MTDQTLDVIAVGAHPDDTEIACGGTLAKLAKQGYRVGIIDLTDGEPTPGSAGPEVRLAEARRAAETLGLAQRVTLNLPNRRLFDTFEARVALATEFRRFRPRLVLGLGAKTPTASPDHYQASLIIEAAVFYSKLTKWDEHFAGTPPYVVPRWLKFFLAFDPMSTGRSARAGGRHQRHAGDEAGGDRLLRQPVFRPGASLRAFSRVRHAARHVGRFRGGRSARPVRPSGARNDLMGLLFRVEQPPRET